MKKNLTKALALAAVMLLCVWSVKGQHAITDGEYFEFTQENITASDWVTYTEAKYAARDKCDKAKPNIPNLSGATRIVEMTVSGCDKFLLQADGNGARNLSITINNNEAVQTVWANGCSEQEFVTNDLGNITIKVAGVDGSVYLSGITFFAPTTPAIASFKIPVADGAIEAEINDEAGTIAAELPFGTDITAVTPVVALQGTAKSYTPAGAQDFTNPVTYTLYDAEDGAGNALKTYTVTLTVAQSQSNDATLKSLSVDGTPLAAFAPETLEYTYDIPYVYEGYPTISADENDPTASVAIDQATTENNGVATVTVTAQDGTKQVYKLTFNRLDAERELTEVVFSNSFSAFIKVTEAEKTVKAYYLQATEAPALQSYKVSEGADVKIEGDKVIVTGKDGKSDEYTLTLEAVAPYVPEATETVTFDGTETWIKSGYDFDASKGWRFAKAVEEAGNKRISEGKTRIYFFVGACEKLTFASATSARDVKVFINGEEDATFTKTAATGATTDLTMNTTAPSMVAVVSNQTGGDGGFSALGITVKATGPSTVCNNPAVDGVWFDGRTIVNPENQWLEVFDVTGRQVIRSNANIDMLAYQGVFVVKGQQDVMKIAISR